MAFRGTVMGYLTPSGEAGYILVLGGRKGTAAEMVLQVPAREFGPESDWLVEALHAPGDVYLDRTEEWLVEDRWDGPVFIHAEILRRHPDWTVRMLVWPDAENVRRTGGVPEALERMVG